MYFNLHNTLFVLEKYPTDLSISARVKRFKNPALLPCRSEESLPSMALGNYLLAPQEFMQFIVFFCRKFTAFGHSSHLTLNDVKFRVINDLYLHLIQHLLLSLYIIDTYIFFSYCYNLLCFYYILTGCL